MCNCGSSTIYSQPTITQRTVTINTECEFNEGILNNWKLKLECVKDKSLYNDIQSSEKEINSFLGVLISALSNLQNICYFENHLQAIAPTIIKIINTGKC
jgi:hypothetical protein